jgi:lysophospholipase L1-like esterase
MLGDSITEGANWNKIFGRTDISNQGIGEDTTEGFVNRLEYIYQLNPELCFIMGGINDLGKNIPINNVFNNIKTIVKELDEHNIKAIIQSTLYVSKKWPFWEKRNKDVMELNFLLEKYCLENDIEFININHVVSKDETLEEMYTNDGVHLLENGYEKWKELIIPMLEKYLK